MHEALHAEIYRILYEYLKKDPNATYTERELKEYLTKRKYHKLWDYFSKYGFKKFQHEYMADYKVEIMSSFLLEYDNSLTKEQIESYVWKGLKSTEAWKNLTEFQKNKYDNLLKATESKASKECN